MLQTDNQYLASIINEGLADNEINANKNLELFAEFINVKEKEVEHGYQQAGTKDLAVNSLKELEVMSGKMKEYQQKVESVFGDPNKTTLDVKGENSLISNMDNVTNS